MTPHGIVPEIPPSASVYLLLTFSDSIRYLHCTRKSLRENTVPKAMDTNEIRSRDSPGGRGKAGHAPGRGPRASSQRKSVAIAGTSHSREGTQGDATTSKTP